MKKNMGIATGIGIAIIVGVIIFQVDQTIWQQASVDEYYEKDGKVAHVVYPDNPQVLGPLQINKDKYLLGENVYVILTGLNLGDKGTVIFMTPENKIYTEWGFDGSRQDSQKKYFKPQLLKSKQLCEKEQLIGEWKVMFKDYEMSKIYFEILPDILPNQEDQFIGCEVSYEIDITKP